VSRRVQFWVGILVSALSLAILFALLDVKQVLHSLAETDWRAAVLLIMSCQVVFQTLRAWRWQIMLGGQLHFWPVFHAQNIGYLITNVLPFRLGDLAKAYLVAQEPDAGGVDMAKSLSTVALERVLDVLLIVAFFGAAMPLVPALPEGMGAAGLLFSTAAVIGFVAMLLAAANRRRVTQFVGRLLGRIKRLDPEVWLPRLESFLHGFDALTSWRLALPVLGLSLALWLAILAAYFGGLRAVWSAATLPAAAVTLCAAAFGISVPSSPGSLGVYHLAVVGGLSVFPLSPRDAASFAFVYHAVMVTGNVGLGLVGLWRRGLSLGPIVRAIQNVKGA
jgi:uncharacterized protein (TIRG00374 family)